MSTPPTFINNTQSPYPMIWQIPNQVLQFSIDGVYTAEGAAQVNTLLTDHLDKADRPITVIIDCMTMTRPTNFEVIRHEQTFMEHPMLSQVYIASNNRLVRFAMMVIFSASSASVRMFDSLEQVQMMVDTRKFKRG